MRVAIIGAGGAGLCAAKHCLHEKIEFDVFEQSGSVGGTWNYTDLVGVDENGLPVHSSMYQGLNTNLPKELMAFEDFPYRLQTKSYLPREEVLAYIESYTKNFQLKPHIKFRTQVLNVTPESNQWSVEFQDIKTKSRTKRNYAAVFVCNGHFSSPFTPEIKGFDSFPGSVRHSHDYRSPLIYQQKRVLVVGGGPSGVDISQQILNVADKVYLSHKVESSRNQSSAAENSIIHKSIITSCAERRFFFDDGSFIDRIDAVLFCTGYYYSFPFLSEACGIRVDDNRVHPLFKHVISIANATLAFIGIPFRVCPFPLFDIQVRFFLATLTGHYKLPDKEEMQKDLDQQLSETSDLRKFHELGAEQGKYSDNLAETAGITKVPSVIDKLYERVRMNRNLDDCFRIIDDDHWEQIN